MCEVSFHRAKRPPLPILLLFSILYYLCWLSVGLWSTRPDYFLSSSTLFHSCLFFPFIHYGELELEVYTPDPSQTESLAFTVRLGWVESHGLGFKFIPDSNTVSNSYSTLTVFHLNNISNHVLCLIAFCDVNDFHGN